MNTRSEYIWLGIIAILVFLYITKRDVEYKDRVEYDTNWVKQDTVFIVKHLKGKTTPGRIDTLYLDSNKAISQLAVKLERTEIINEQGDTAWLSLDYVFPPINEFRNIELSYKEKIIEKTKEIMKTITKIERIPFYENSFFWISIVELLIIIIAL